MIGLGSLTLNPERQRRKTVTAENYHKIPLQTKIFAHKRIDGKIKESIFLIFKRKTFAPLSPAFCMLGDRALVLKLVLLSKSLCGRGKTFLF
jgi:hypothetical protein